MAGTGLARDYAVAVILALVFLFAFFGISLMLPEMSDTVAAVYIAASFGAACKLSALLVNHWIETRED